LLGAGLIARCSWLDGRAGRWRIASVPLHAYRRVVSDVPVRAAVLGPLEVTRDGGRVEPTSPKQRALLIDLLIHRGKTLGRDRLIDDLWGDEPPSTAAGVLQNYMSQLRRALGADAVRTVGTGYTLGHEVCVDIAELEAHLERARSAREVGDAEAVRAAAAAALGLWRGDALADIASEPFAQPEIRRLAELRALALELQLEAEITAGGHTAAVAALERAVADHPLRERLWWLLMVALHRSGRQADALRTYQRARTTLGEELGIEPSTELRALEQAILAQHVDVDVMLGGRRRHPPGRRPRPAPPMLGRDREWSVVVSALDHEGDPAGGLLLLVGEPGIGKTRLLEEASVHVAARAGTVVAGRAFEAERGRPYGAWIDALRSTPLDDVAAAERVRLGPLLPELSDEPCDLDEPNRLYDAVVQVLASLAKDHPVAVMLDDIHWLDEASGALLHFAVRRLADADVAFVATARVAELDDNSACRRVIEALRREDELHELPIGPLASSTIAELTEQIAPGADSSRIAAATNGNPLFAVEMAKAVARGEEPLSNRVDALIGDRLARLDEHALALVPWAAAFGRALAPNLLAAIANREPAELFEALAELERHGVLRSDANGDVDFVHDLVRTAAYTGVSPPRRGMLHARIAAVLAAQPDPDDILAADTARHADAAADSATCSSACVRAARRCVRLLAYGEADELVSLGRTHARRLAPAERLRTELELIHVLLHPGIRLRDPGDLGRELTDLCADAQRLGLDAELTIGLSLLARVHHWGWGDIPRARALLDRAVRVIESSHTPNIEPLLECARCLAYLEIDMPRTAQLFDELRRLHALAEHSVQYQWGRGLVDAWRGDSGAARAALTRAIELATRSTDHWIMFECIARLVLLELEEGAVDAAGVLCAQLGPLAEKLSEGSERAYAAGISAVQALAGGADDGEAMLDDAIASLERIDARFLVPDLLGLAAEHFYRTGRLDRAQRRAEAAGEIAAEVGRPNERARAHALLACIAAARGRADESRRQLGQIDAAEGSLPGHVAGLRQQAERLIRALGDR
jgi:DNA-binding SARP family transcriptional activator/tetratricopeptide (TPR) repeat protein